jgi:hypothetical protein
MLLFLGIVNYLRWSKEQLQFFKVALELSRDVRGKFGGGTVSSRRCQGTLVAYPPVTGQGRLNGCGSAKAG